MRSRSPPGPRAIRDDRGCVTSIGFDVVASASPAIVPSIEVLVRRAGDVVCEWVRVDPAADGTYPMPFPCTIYGWRMA